MIDAILDVTLTAAARVITGCRARWLAPPPLTGAAVFFGNHTSHLDTLAIRSALPRELRRRCRPVAARDYWSRTGLRRWVATRALRAVLIERQHVDRHSNPLPALIELLDRGEAIILFPEGGRRDDQETGDFRSGLFHIARKRPQTPLYPVLLENLNRILPRGEVLPVPLIGSVVIGEPIHLLVDETKQGFLARARGALDSLRSR